MSVDNLTTGIVAASTEETEADDANAEVDAPVADVIRPRPTRPYRYVKKGPLHSIFRYL